MDGQSARWHLLLGCHTVAGAVEEVEAVEQLAMTPTLTLDVLPRGMRPTWELAG